MRRFIAFIIVLPFSCVSFEPPLVQKEVPQTKTDCVFTIPDRVDQYKFSPDGLRLLTIKSVPHNHLAKNYLIKLYATATGGLLESFPDRLSARIKWSPNSSYFVLRGLDKREIAIMDKQGDLIRTIKTTHMPHKFHFSSDELHLLYYFNLVGVDRCIKTPINTDESSEIKAELPYHKSQEPPFSFPEPVCINNEWFTITPCRFFTLDSKYSISYVQKIGDNDPANKQLLIVPTGEEKQTITSGSLPLTAKLNKPFDFVHYTHDPAIIVLASYDKLVYAVNIATRQVIPLTFRLNKSDLIKPYDTYKRKPRPFISKNGLYLQDDQGSTKVCTLDWAKVEKK